jgi:Tripartite tricarboxylate transporter family receptor
VNALLLRGTLSHLGGEALQQRAGIKLVMVPYLGGTSQALNDVITGRVPMVIDAYPPVAGALQAGSIRALAVGSAKRLPDFPDLPTTGEILPGFSPNGWLALVAPVGTPDAIVRKLSDGLRDAVTDPATRTKLETTGTTPIRCRHPSCCRSSRRNRGPGSRCSMRSHAIPEEIASSSVVRHLCAASFRAGRHLSAVNGSQIN